MDFVRLSAHSSAKTQSLSQFQLKKAAQQLVLETGVLPGNVVRFSGQAVSQAGRNGLWITTELAPYAVVGGLGQVSETIPEALNRHLNKDVRVLAPMLASMANHPDFQPTGMQTRLQGPDGQWETFELFQRNQPDKPIIYAIANQKYFGRHANLYFPKDKPVEGIGEDAIFKAMMMFNRAAAVFAPQLNSVAAESAKPVVAVADTAKRFDGTVDFVMVHDWLTAPFLSELPADYRESVGKVFMLHNTFNEARSLETALKENRMTLPPASACDPASGRYSPLSIGISMSDVVVANRNYADRIAKILSTKSDYGAALRGQIASQSVFDMHHGLSNRYDPYDNPALKVDGFVELSPRVPRSKPIQALSAITPIPIKRAVKRLLKLNAPEMEAIDTFKKTNKLALQKKLQLKEEPKAVIFTWIARPDPHQKGFYLLMDEAKRFLTEHPQTQLIISGPVPGKTSPQVEAFMQELLTSPEFKNRVAFPGFVSYKEVAQFNAGSDFMILPSLYEPYGLSQLEAKKLGNIPIVHGVDGLRSTVSDSRMNRRIPGPQETVWQYGQTGILMKPLNVLAYWTGLDKRLKNQPLNREDQHALKQAQLSFHKAMERALKLTEDPEKTLRVRLNGMRFVEEQHQWESITPRYLAPIEAALAKVQAQKAADQTPQPQFA